MRLVTSGFGATGPNRRAEDCASGVVVTNVERPRNEHWRNEQLREEARQQSRLLRLFYPRIASSIAAATAGIPTSVETLTRPARSGLNETNSWWLRPCRTGKMRLRPSLVSNATNPDSSM